MYYQNYITFKILNGNMNIFSRKFSVTFVSFVIKLMGKYEKEIKNMCSARELNSGSLAWKSDALTARLSLMIL